MHTTHHDIVRETPHTESFKFNDGRHWVLVVDVVRYVRKSGFELKGHMSEEMKNYGTDSTGSYIFANFFFAEGTATFIAKIGGDPIPSVKWMKGKWRQITPGGRISIEHKGQDAKMEIREVTKSDSGLYRCVATNKHGEIECGAEMEVSKTEEKEGLGDIRTRLKK